MDAKKSNFDCTNNTYGRGDKVELFNNSKYNMTKITELRPL